MNGMNAPKGMYSDIRDYFFMVYANYIKFISNSGSYTSKL